MTINMPRKGLNLRKGRRSRVNLDLESNQQIALVKWARLKGLILISIPNHGKRTVWGGRREKDMGLTVGVSDLFLSMPNKYFHGFWIELKSKGKFPTDLQYAWLIKMRAMGYCADWFDDWEKAKIAIEFYVSELENV